MNKQFRKAFESIHASEQMKRSTCDFLSGEIEKRKHKSAIPVRYAMIMCTMFILVICGFGSYSLFITPVSYISVDVNPSVELGLNRLDRVVTAKAYNDDGAAVLENLNLKNKPYTEAVELLLADKIFESYLSEDALLTFTVVSDKEEALLEGIQQCRGYESANGECHGADAQLVEDAHHNGLSLGKYQAFLELSQYDKTITAKDCQSLSMREIRDLLSQYKGQTETPGGNGHGHRRGKCKNNS